MRILHLEDSVIDAELIEARVREEWPDCTFTRVSTREAYEAHLREGAFDLVLTDYTLPDFDGLAALELARQWCPHKPFIFLSGTIGEERAVEALREGAFDYVLKDRLSRLLPAVHKAMARSAEIRRRHAAEARVAELASLLDKARDAIMVVTLQGDVTFWNASAVRLFGWTITEAMGRNLLGLVFGEDRLSGAEALAAVQRSGDWSGELHLISRTGQPVTVESRWTLVADAVGQPHSVLLINTDVTERKRLEGQLLRAQRLESVGTLASGLAHDLNNVLSPIIMATSVLKLQLTNSEDLHLLNSIETTAQYGSSLIRQLLAFGRGTEGERVRVDVKKLIEDLETLLRPSLGKEISLRTTVDSAAWPILADPTQVSQALINLCVNARDAMPAGGRIEIVTANVTFDPSVARIYSEVAPGRFLQITVSDTGNGISPEIIDRIFDPFFTTRGPGKGTGLGLSTVRGILKGHGGFVTVESTLGQGTLFRLFFPAAPASD